MVERFDTPVRCSQGHLYTSSWMPLGSFKAIRMGAYRIQRCPVGKHWAKTYRVDPSELTAQQAAEAAATHDARIL
jgi:hypothetical protein